MTTQRFDKSTALAFVISFGIVSLFADAAYEGMRAISGPYLALLGASGFAVGFIAGTGELAGYMLRLLSGSAADRTKLYWPITLGGYVVQMAAVPLLAFAGNWWAAAALIILERAGKATRNPPRDAMLARAGDEIGHGWAFGLHEALDQAGAVAGPLIAAGVIALHGDYRTAFLWLGVPAALTLLSLFSVRLRFPFAGETPLHHDTGDGVALPRAFWLYAAAAALVAFGFADFTLVAFHFAKANIADPAWIPLFYAAAMGSDGLASLVFGRWFDTRGLWILVPGTLLSVLVAPLAFMGGFTAALIATLLWGAALGVHESVMSAAVARLVPAAARARAFGIFSAAFGIAWFVGSVALGGLYDISLSALVTVSVVAELAALVPLFAAIRAAALRT